MGMSNDAKTVVIRGLVSTVLVERGEEKTVEWCPEKFQPLVERGFIEVVADTSVRVRKFRPTGPQGNIALSVGVGGDSALVSDGPVSGVAAKKSTTSGKTPSTGKAANAGSVTSTGSTGAASTSGTSSTGK